MDIFRDYNILLGYLWVLTLSIIPILFSTPVYLNDMDYWAQNKYSLTYTVGDYFAPWWISGVILHGIWQWSLVLLCPLCCVIYMVLLTCCCCIGKIVNNRKEESTYWTVKVGPFMVVPVIVIGIFVIIVSSVGFIPLFIGNMTMWNDVTYPDMSKIIENIGGLDGYNDEGVMILEILIGVGVLLVIIPIYACILTLITKNTEREREEDTRGIHYAKRSFKKLPIVNPREWIDKVEMGRHGNENYNIYT